MVRFNPHPSRRTGATFWACVWYTFCWVSILTRPEGRVQRIIGGSCRLRCAFQSSPVPKDGCNLPDTKTATEAMYVSILTRPEGRVQHFLKNFSDGGYSFQSSPVPKDGCNQKQRKATATSVSFNPHPSRRTGATWAYGHAGGLHGVSILTRPEGRVQPLPEQLEAVRAWLFQSSPVPKVGCNENPYARQLAERAVSILTRPEGRVQPGYR